jgi:hypothetical protein
VLPGDLDEPRALPGGEHPAQRVVQGRHRVHRPDPATAAQPVERVGIGTVGGHRQRCEVERAGEHPEPRVGEGVHRDDVAGPQQRHGRHRQPVLGAVDDQLARGPLATADGCLASTYLATWVLARLHGLEAAEHAMHYVAPVGEKDEYVERALRNVTPYLEPAAISA